MEEVKDNSDGIYNFPLPSDTPREIYLDPLYSKF